jgi:hypothetical protein
MYGAFNMFKSLLSHLESIQVTEFPSYHMDLIQVAREKAQMHKGAADKSNKMLLKLRRMQSLVLWMIL